MSDPDGGKVVINADSFTRLKQTAEGTLAPGNMERLDEYLLELDGEIHYRIRGSAVLGSDGRELRKLALKVTGWLTLQDQITLQPVRHELDLESKLVLVRSEEELPPLEAESDDEDYIVVDREIDLAELVEDEVILDLPMIPHQDLQGGAESMAESAMDVQTEKKSPFAALAALKKPNS
jgi:uncharacterized protein